MYLINKYSSLRAFQCNVIKTKSINKEVLIGPHVYIETGYVLLVKSKTSVLKNNMKPEDFFL